MTPDPAFIRSADDFVAAVQLNVTTESKYLDFKAQVDNWDVPRGTAERDRLKRNAQKEACRDIAQFANTFGGCLLIGVSEGPAKGRTLKLASGLQSIVDAHGLRQWIEDSIVNFLVPSTFEHDVTPITLTDGEMLLAINVPASIHLVSLWDRESHTVEYVCRTSHGKRWMNPDEAERHIMDGSRVSKLKLTAAVDSAPDPKDVEIVGAIWIRLGENVLQRWAGRSPLARIATGDHTFELNFHVDAAAYSLTLPYSLVTEAWLGGNGKIYLLLSIRIVFEHGSRLFTVETHL